MDINIVKDCNSIDFNEVFNLIKVAGLSFKDVETHKKCFLNSQVSIFLYDNKVLIGVGRAISDYVRHGAIYDVAINPNYQGNGLGKIIIEEIKKELPNCSLILYASPGKEGFYEKLGFSRMKTGMAYFDNERVMRDRGFID